MQISVVIPAFNEVERIASTLARIVDYLRDRSLDYEVLVVDDGSTDETVRIAGRFGDRGVRVISLEQNRGKGAAIRTGVLASVGERVLITDADLSTPIEDLERLDSRLRIAPVVFGSRARSDSEILVHQGRMRETMGRCFNLIIRILGVRGMKDTQCGFKLLRGDVARALFSGMRVDRFAYDVELLCRARRAGLTVVDVGVRWADSPQSKVSPFSDAFRMFWDVLLIQARGVFARPQVQLEKVFELPTPDAPPAATGAQRDAAESAERPTAPRS